MFGGVFTRCTLTILDVLMGLCFGQALVQCHGMDDLKPNTILLGWPGAESNAGAFGANIRLLARMRWSILAARFLTQRTDESGAMDAALVRLGFQTSESGE